MYRILVSFFVIGLTLSLQGQTITKFTSGQIELFYETEGSGPPLYLLTGGPGEAPGHHFQLLIDSLKPYYTCILLHQRGSGLSRNISINSQTISIDNYVEDIKQLQDNRKDKQIALLGNSWGGLLAQAYAAKYPKLVSQLFLVASAPPSYKVWNVLYDNQFTRRSKAELDSMKLLQEIFSTKSEYELDSIKRINPTDPQVLAYKAFLNIHIRAMYYDKSKISATDFDTLFLNFNFQPIPIIDREVLETKWDITAKLQKLKIPALIIYGRQDDQGESTFYLQKESLRNNQVYVIEQCGHSILEEQPTVFFNILMPYVKRQITKAATNKK